MKYFFCFEPFETVDRLPASLLCLVCQKDNICKKKKTTVQSSHPKNFTFDCSKVADTRNDFV